MNREDYEKYFDDFLENKVYDDAEDGIFRLVRAAFKAGFLAAGGKYPDDEEGIVDIFKK